MSRPVSPFDHGYEASSTHELQPCTSGPSTPVEDGSIPGEERHGTDMKQLPSSRSQTLTSNVAKSYMRNTSEHVKAGICKLKTFLQKKKMDRRTYWTAVALGLITTVCSIYGLVFQGRGNAIADRGILIAEQSKNTTEGIAVAGFIINCHNIQLAGLDPGPDCAKYKAAKLKAPTGIDNYVIHGDDRRRAANTMPTSVALPANSSIKTHPSDIGKAPHWDQVLAIVVNFTDSMAQHSQSIFKGVYPDTDEDLTGNGMLERMALLSSIYLTTYSLYHVLEDPGLIKLIPAQCLHVLGIVIWSAQSAYPASSTILSRTSATLEFLSLSTILAQASESLLLHLSSKCRDRPSAVQVQVEVLV